jgi:hypothetical protein
LLSARPLLLRTSLIAFFSPSLSLSGLLGQMFDGVLRPLDQIKTVSNSIYIPRGIHVDALPKDKLWEFIPDPSLKVRFADAHCNITVLTRVALFCNVRSVLA